VTGGADDNASGAASVIEVARVAAANRLAGANCFALFSGEEFGLFGSKAFINALSADQLNKVRVMINLDVVGVSGALGVDRRPRPRRDRTAAGAETRRQRRAVGTPAGRR